MTKEQIAYLAGFIDADGTISIRKDRKKYKPHISISNTNRPVLEYFYDLIGSGAICNHGRSKKNHAKAYSIRWEYNKALKIAKFCYPYLHVKKERAGLLINEWKAYTPRNGYYTPEIWEKKLDLVKRMRVLNKRGPKRGLDFG